MLKFTSKIEYNVSYDRDDADNNKIIKTYRECTITITGVTREQVSDIFDNCINYMQSQVNYPLEPSNCPVWEKQFDKWVYVDSISIDNKEEYEEIKQLYKKWKSNITESRYKIK